MTAEFSDESLKNRWWFGLPEQVTDRLVAHLQQWGVLVIAAINRFRYPAHGHMAVARKEIARLVKLGVHGLQIDSVYFDLVQEVIGYRN